VKLQLLVVTLLLCAMQQLALGCACCSEEDQRSTYTGRPTDQQLAGIPQMKFAPEARVWVGTSDLEEVRGRPRFARAVHTRVPGPRQQL
jgi:hypothetical protein